MTERDAGLSYCRGPAKRAFDLAGSLVSLIVLAPLVVLLALLVVAFMGRPVFFVQERIGQDGRPFRLLKFRTMRARVAPGLEITGSGDPRITRLGRLLRATKLDELPQFLNVLRGHMSLVGPRPEVPRYVALYTPEQRRVLLARPGLTDPATLLFRDEESLLGSVPESGRERYYIEDILPTKLAINLDYLVRAGFIYDLKLLGRTLMAIMRGRAG